jgi:hypothetical protein
VGEGENIHLYKKQIISSQRNDYILTRRFRIPDIIEVTHRSSSLMRKLSSRTLGRVAQLNRSSTLRPKNAPPERFLNVALRPPPVADKGSKSARQNKELKDCERALRTTTIF